MSNLVPRVFSFSNMATVCWKTSRTWGWGCRNEHRGYRWRHWSMRSERCTRLRWLETLLSIGLFVESSRFPIFRCHVGKREDPGNKVRFWGKYNPGQNSWDTNAIASQIEASSLPLPPRCNVDVMHSSFNLTQSTLLGGEGDSRNSPL